MLLRLNKTYFILAWLLYSFFLFSTSNEFLPLYFLHILTFVAYVFVLADALKKKDDYYSKQNLLSTIFIFSSLIVIVYKYTSYKYNNNFFVFSEADALTYYKISLIMASMSVMESINYYLSYYNIDDLGAVLLTSMLYRFIESILFLNFTYIITGLITAFGIYRISSCFMSLKFAFVCSLAYSTSSFVLWFHSSGLKESAMCMLIVIFFDRYYLYIRKKAFIHLVYASLFLTTLLLFRPALIFFCIGAVVLGLVLQRKKGMSGAIVIILAFASIIGLYPIFESTYDRFLMGGDFNQMLTSKESMIKGSTQFTYAVNLLAQLIGPLPTISPDTKVMLSFFSAGLIYKVLLSILFWAGVHYVFKLKAEMLYPLIFFAFFEMISLLLILEGLELRKSLPHFPMIYIIAFWFMDQYESTENFKDIKIRRRINSLFTLSSIAVFFLILAWNIRNQML